MDELSQGGWIIFSNKTGLGLAHHTLLAILGHIHTLTDSQHLNPVSLSPPVHWSALTIYNTWLPFPSHFFQLKEGLRWQELPRCFLPERLREVRIDGLHQDGVEDCMEVIVDEDHDAASTSHNFLEQGKGASTVHRGWDGFPISCDSFYICFNVPFFFPFSPPRLLFSIF